MPQNMPAIQTPPTSEVQLGEQGGNQSEDKTITSLRPNSPASSEDSNYWSCKESSSEEEDSLMNEHNEIFAVQREPASEIQSGEQDANQSEEDPIHNPRSVSPMRSKDSSDHSVVPCEEQGILTHKMEHLQQRGQDVLEEDSLTTGQNEMSALQTLPTSEIQPEQNANQSEDETIHNPRSASPTSSKASSDGSIDPCEEQDLLTHRMKHLQQRSQEYSEEGKGGDLTFGPGEDENETSCLHNENESRPKYNMKVPVWRSIWSHVCSAGSFFRKQVRNIWGKVCPCSEMELF